MSQYVVSLSIGRNHPTAQIKGFEGGFPVDVEVYDTKGQAEAAVTRLVRTFGVNPDNLFIFERPGGPADVPHLCQEGRHGDV